MLNIIEFSDQIYITELNISQILENISAVMKKLLGKFLSNELRNSV